MFEQFEKAYGLGGSKARIESFFPTCSTLTWARLASDFSEVVGAEFGNGIYRLHSSSEIKYWTEIVGNTFPQYASRVFCFGCDWMGRQFALDGARSNNGEPLVLMFEPGMNQVLEIPANFFQFHNVELVEFHDAALASDFFQAWIASDRQPPRKHQCVGYIKPIYLGGEDTLDNLEFIDLDVYWAIFVQLLEKIRGLPVGTIIEKVTID